MRIERNGWIGVDAQPIEESVPSLPPPLAEDFDQEDSYRRTALLNIAAAYFKETDFKLPEMSSFINYKTEGLQLEPELIQGILRRGHKLMVSGASKSGKSFMLIELALCMASGRPWMGYKCEECKVLYVNLEISEPSFAHRIECVSDAMDVNMNACDINLKIINLRGISVDLKKMSGALIGTILTEEAETGVPFSAVILDPIYKISNGEENSAKDVGAFCHELDRIATATGASIIYSHHHSKGDQGYKSAQDRASGSGVFARDADAMIDMIELDIDKETYLAMRGQFACAYWIRLLNENFPDWKDGVSEDSLEKSGDLASIYQNKAHVTSKVLSYLNANIDDAFTASMKGSVPIRIEFTLREFASPDPVNVFFRHPVHVLDEAGVLAAADPKSHIQGQKQASARAARKTKTEAFYEAVCKVITENGYATYQDLVAETGFKERTVKDRVKELGDEFKVVTGGGKDKTMIYFREENEDGNSVE